jgi:hypothetical protein
MIDLKNLNLVQETYINGLLSENKKRETRLKPIRELLKQYYIENIWELNDLQIVKVKSRNDKEWYYATFINYKSLNEFAFSFDQALLICLAYKYDNNRSDAVAYMSRMLNMKNEPEEINRESE